MPAIISYSGAYGRAGGFGRAGLLEQCLQEQAQYRAFTRLSDWKTIAAPLGLQASGSEERGSAAAQNDLLVTQKVLMRQQRRSHWEEAAINLELRDTPSGRRWLVVSIYKHAAGADEAVGEDTADPEDSRDC